MFPRWLVVAVIAAGSLALSGCYARARVHHPPVYAGTTVSTGYVDHGMVVYAAPPSPPAVVIHTPPPAPYHGAVWVDGYYTWTGSAYVWTSGHYVQPRAGYVYVQPRWERQGRGYVHVGGWRARGHGHVHVNPGRPHHRAAPVRARPPAARGSVRGRGSVRVR